MIFEWKLDEDTRNFGDALYEIILEPDIREKWQADEKFMFFPLGSVICNIVMEETLDLGYEPVFIGCGWRGEPLNSNLVSHCLFVGARGPHTKQELVRHDVRVDVTLDPAYEVAQLIKKAEPNALALALRHIKDPGEYDYNSMHEMKADAIFSPVVETRDDIVQLIEIISGARFVLTGSLHGAILAHAYGVPFAPLESEYIDCPPKWADWFASIGLGEPVFVDNIVEGRKWYSSTGIERKAFKI